MTCSSVRTEHAIIFPLFLLKFYCFIAAPQIYCELKVRIVNGDASALEADVKVAPSIILHTNTVQKKIPTVRELFSTKFFTFIVPRY